MDGSKITGGVDATEALGKELRSLLADVFALYLKTKNFHWHMKGPHFRDYHLLLDEQGEELFSMTDAIAERARKLEQETIHSIGEISRFQRLSDNETRGISAEVMLAILCEDNRQLRGFMSKTHELCGRNGDLATASLLENWIDETERRSWFLRETLL